MKQIRFRFTRSADADLDVIWESIAQDNPEAANRLVGEIYERVQILAKFVRIGHSRPDLVGQRPVLFSAIRKYLIVYEVLDDVLIVLAVLHSACDIPAILHHRKADV